MHPTIATASGYASGEYAASLAHLGEAVALPASGAHLLRRPIPAQGFDLAAPYPLLVLPQPNGLASDVAALAETGAVSVTAVSTP